jgi:drug/metabolite transporter (DMT)-like permease
VSVSRCVLLRFPRRNFKIFVLFLSCAVAVHMSTSPTPPTQYHLQLFVNLWSFLIVFAYTILSSRIVFSIEFMRRHPSTLWLLIKLAGLSGIGQIFIYGTMVMFNPLVLSIITTTRKFFTILVSSFAFSHSFNPTQWVAIVVLFAGLLWQVICIIFPFQLDLIC